MLTYEWRRLTVEDHGYLGNHAAGVNAVGPSSAVNVT